MNPPPPTRPIAALGVLAAAGALAVGAALGAPAALGAAPSRAHPPLALESAGAIRKANVSTNWAGYVAVRTPAAGSDFSSVSATWTQPNASCTARRESYSAIWVGLGGYGAHARALEQIGTDADCARSGATSYAAWYELLPAGSVRVKLTVRPGDQLSASVTVRRRDVTLRISDLTTGARFSATKRAARVDASSAEWIVEAPSACVNSQTCDVLALTDFGEVAFSSATATASSHTGPIGDPDWSASALELQQQTTTGRGRRTHARVAPPTTLILATPSPLTSSGEAFSVNWQEQAPQAQSPSAQTLPGSGSAPS